MRQRYNAMDACTRLHFCRSGSSALAAITPLRCRTDVRSGEGVRDADGAQRRHAGEACKEAAAADEGHTPGLSGGGACSAGSLRSGRSSRRGRAYGGWHAGTLARWHEAQGERVSLRRPALRGPQSLVCDKGIGTTTQQGEQQHRAGTTATNGAPRQSTSHDWCVRQSSHDRCSPGGADF